MIEKSITSDVPPRFSIENIEVDTLSNTITAGEVECSVEPRLIRIIVKLAQGAGETVARSELLKEISEQTIVSDESLTQAVSKIRQLLDDDPKRPRFIKTVPRKGYMLLVQAIPVPNDCSENVEANSNSTMVDREKSHLMLAINRKYVVFGLVFLTILALITIVLWPEDETVFIEKEDVEFIEKVD